MLNPIAYLLCMVHCRIGSLEVLMVVVLDFQLVHCRIGSLEDLHLGFFAPVNVHCRIGSLEVLFLVILMQARYSVSNSCNKKPIISAR